MIELRYKDRIVSNTGVAASGGSTMDPFNDTHLYMGWSSTRGLLCVSSELEKFIGDKLHEESLANKERRKAEELRKAPPPAKK